MSEVTTLPAAGRRSVLLAVLTKLDEALCEQVFNAAGDQATPEAELLGHEGPVWQVAWAHPKFGNILAASTTGSSSGRRPKWASGHRYHTLAVKQVVFSPNVK